MREPYMPDTDAVRLAYVDREDFIAQLARTERKDDSKYEAAFDHWLGHVKAEARREGQAEAWDAGAQAQAAAYGMDKDTGPNPYRNGGGQ